MMERLERRAAQRSPAGFRAHILAANGFAVARPEPAIVHNISTGGLGMLTGMPVQQGETVLVAFAFPGEDQRSEVEVKVIEAQRLITREYLAHCAFTSLAPQIKQMVVDWTDARGPV